MEDKQECVKICSKFCMAQIVKDCNECENDKLSKEEIISNYKKWIMERQDLLDCYDLFPNTCSRHDDCVGCSFDGVAIPELIYHYRLWGDEEPIEKSDLDILIEEEEKEENVKIEKDKKYSALAIFDINVNELFQKNEKTYYSFSKNTWKDGIVFKFPRGIPEIGKPCIAIFKYDIRNKYHDFAVGCPRTTGRGMPYSLGKYEKGELKYGIRPVVHIYPATKDLSRDEIRYRLVYVSYAKRNTYRGGNSSGRLENCEKGTIIHQITGSESSASGNHGAIHICAVVEGSPRIREIRVANDTGNIREFVRNL